MTTELCTNILQPFQQKLHGVIAELWRGCSPQMVPVTAVVLPSAKHGVHVPGGGLGQPEPGPEPEQEPIGLTLELDDEATAVATADEVESATIEHISTQPQPSHDAAVHFRTLSQNSDIELETSPVPRLPSGWSSAVSRRTGEIYFFNLATGERASDHPLLRASCATFMTMHKET